MTINRRRAPSSLISSTKKLDGHSAEDLFANLIDGKVLKGTQKGDVKDKSNNLYSVKSGKKWQIFLYRYDRISSSINLKILKTCLDSFPENYEFYVSDRVKCISYKEKLVNELGATKVNQIPNSVIEQDLFPNSYIEAKSKLGVSSKLVRNYLMDKKNLREFLNEAIFNNDEVEYLAIKDTHYLEDNKFKIFHKNDVLDVFVSNLIPAISDAGKVAVDYNVAGQKTLLKYVKGGKKKNIVEIEIRNDSAKHYREVRFNMYSKDALKLLLESDLCTVSKTVNQYVIAYGQAARNFNTN